MLTLKHVIDVDRSETGPPHQEMDALLRKLVEAEIDGQAAAKQVAALRETVGKLKKVRRWTNDAVASEIFSCK